MGGGVRAVALSRGTLERRRLLVAGLVLALLASISVIVPQATPKTLAFDGPGVQSSRTYYVSDGAGPTGGPCDTADTSTGNYADEAGAIQDALNLAATDGTADDVVIHLCTGTFDFSTGVSISSGDDGSGNPDSSVTIEGESSTGTIVRRSPGADPANTFPLLRLLWDGETDVGVDVAVADLTLRGGREQDWGAALKTHEPANYSVDISSVRFIDNVAELGNGGAITTGGPTTITDSLFTDNTAGGRGGAVFSWSDVAITDSTFTDNSAGGRGGAVYADRLDITSSTFADNASVEQGGAAMAEDVMTVDGGTFVGNVSTADAGGALNANYVSIDRSVFEGNRAGLWGGAILTHFQSTIDASSFRGNRAVLGGGAVLAVDGPLAIGTSTFVDNTAASGPGGAVGNYYTRIDITSSTFARNVAVGDGGAIDGQDVGIVDSTFFENKAKGTGNGGAVKASANVDVTHGTFVGNTAKGTGGNANVSGTLTTTNSLFAGGTCVTTTLTEIGGSVADDGSCLDTSSPVTSSSLELEPLRDNGGPTPTVGLQSGSSAIDAVACLPEVTTDQRGFDRPNPAGDTECDAGAFEAGLWTTISTQVSDASITTGDTVSDTATVTTVDPGTVDPEGVVDFYFCYSPSAAPTECTSGTWGVAGSETIADDGTGDGSTQVTLADWAPPFGGGWYLLSAVFSSSDPTYAGSQTTGDTANESVHVQPAVTIAYNGPWQFGSNAPLPSVRIAGIIVPQVAGCEVLFSVSGGDGVNAFAGPVLYGATTGGDGVASVEVSNGTAGLYGIYEVTVDVVDGTCVNAGTASQGSFAILPGQVVNGSVGGGWTRTDGTRANFAHVISVTTSTAKTRAGTVTTTTTKGSLLWSTNDWRLKAKILRSSTDGSSAWVRYGACSKAYGVDVSVGTSTSYPVCGEFSGTGATLEAWDPDVEAWVPSATVRYTVRVYDGGKVTTCTSKGKSCKTVELADWYGIRIWSGNTLLGISYAPIQMDKSSGNGSITNTPK